ncbi:MAG TPA: hypothetical protein DCS66_03875, partial [Flavobacteriaceae bacterium]|nr:hypothetical protein [Flavobacteriaceae bacterium]
GSDIGGEALAQEVATRLSVKHENLEDIQAMELDYKGVGEIAMIKSAYPDMPDHLADEVRLLVEDNPGTDIETIVESHFGGAYKKEPDIEDDIDPGSLEPLAAVNIETATAPEALTTVPPEEGEG